MTTFQITIDEIKLEGKWFGPESSDLPIVVLLHDGLGSVSTWRDFPELIAESIGVRAFAYSRTGHGQSSQAELPRQPDALHREALDILPRILKEIGFRRGILLGHSDGASIATVYAGHVHDQGVEGLVLIEPHFNVEEKNLNSIREIVRTFNSSDLRSRLARHHHNVDATFAAWSGMWLDPRFASFNIVSELASIRVPMLLVKSQNDPYSTMLQIDLAKGAGLGSVETVVIPGDSHSPHRGNPKQTLDAIATFSNKILSGQPRTKSSQG